MRYAGKGEDNLYLNTYFTGGFWFLLLNWPEAVAIQGGSALCGKKAPTPFLCSLTPATLVTFMFLQSNFSDCSFYICSLFHSCLLGILLHPIAVCVPCDRRYCALMYFFLDNSPVSRTVLGL